MSFSFYDQSVGSYLQTLEATSKILARGRAFAEENGIDLEEMVAYRLRDDMLPLSFQVVSVWHHSLGALKGMQAGVFTPPPKLDPMNYTQLEELLQGAIEEFKAFSRSDIDALAGRDIVFKIGGREIPFTTDSFLASCSLPNLYFHATTTYMIWRIKGAPLGKLDFLGQLRVAAPPTAGS